MGKFFKGFDNMLNLLPGYVMGLLGRDRFADVGADIGRNVRDHGTETDTALGDVNQLLKTGSGSGKGAPDFRVLGCFAAVDVFQVRVYGCDQLQPVVQDGG